MKDINHEQLGRKLATLAATIIVAFLCGWSATGLTGGVVFALALGAGAAVAIFSENRADCLRLRRRGRTSRK